MCLCVHKYACVYMCAMEGMHVEVREQFWGQSSPSTLFEKALLCVPGQMAYVLLKNSLLLPPHVHRNVGILDTCAT